MRKCGILEKFWKILEILEKFWKNSGTILENPGKSWKIPENSGPGLNWAFPEFQYED